MPDITTPGGSVIKDDPNYPIIEATGGGAVTQYKPETYGAKRDGVTDDTAAIKACIAAAVTACQASGTNYCEVQFSAGIYVVNGALDTTKSGRAQIPLPVIAQTAQKVILVLLGAQDATAFPHWLQTTTQRAGTVLKTNLAAAFDPSFGSASVIGGPTYQQTSGGTIWSNMLVVIDGLVILSPVDPQHIGIDLQQVAQADIPNLACSASVAPGTAQPSTPTNGGGALRMPQTGNNDNCNIGNLGVEGYTYGLIPNEHTTAQRVALIYCQYGVALQATYPDSIRIDYLSTEGCKYHISTGAGAGVNGSIDRCRLDVGTWDVEDFSNISTTAHIDDPTNLITGTFGFHRNSTSAGAASDGLSGLGTPPIMNGGAKTRVVDMHRVPGAATAPSVPATTVALVNPFWRDAAVHVAGGTVTVIAVDGQATGVTAGLVMVPPGKTITLTYSVAPTWKWTLI